MNKDTFIFYYMGPLCFHESSKFGLLSSIFAFKKIKINDFWIINQKEENKKKEKRKKEAFINVFSVSFLVYVFGYHLFY